MGRTLNHTDRALLEYTLQAYEGHALVFTWGVVPTRRLGGFEYTVKIAVLKPNAAGLPVFRIVAALARCAHTSPARTVSLAKKIAKEYDRTYASEVRDGTPAREVLPFGKRSKVNG